MFHRFVILCAMVLASSLYAMEHVCEMPHFIKELRNETKAIVEIQIYFLPFEVCSTLAPSEISEYIKRFKAWLRPDESVFFPDIPLSREIVIIIEINGRDTFLQRIIHINTRIRITQRNGVILDSIRPPIAHEKDQRREKSAIISPRGDA